MNFYGIDYLQTQSTLNDYLKYLFIFLVLIILVVAFSFYLKHRIQTKYRELSIIMFLILLFVSGIQYSDYQMSQTRQSQSSQMVGFIEQVAKEKGVKKGQIFANTTQLTDGIIIKVEETFFKVTLSPDQSSYTLQETYLMNPKITIIK